MRADSKGEAAYKAKRRADKESMAEAIESQNRPLKDAGEYRGHRLYMSQYAHFKSDKLDGWWTSKLVLQRHIDDLMARTQA